MAKKLKLRKTTELTFTQAMWHIKEYGGTAELDNSNSLFNEKEVIRITYNKNDYKNASICVPFHAIESSYWKIVETEKILIYTDGAAINNPGEGGYGIVIKCGKDYKELSGGAESTTNNRMELMGAIVGIESIEGENETIEIYSDSKYVVDSVMEGWVFHWEERNYENKQGKRLNADLWKRFLVAYRKHNVKLIWIKGHAGHVENERCDKLAVDFARSFLL